MIASSVSNNSFTEIANSTPSNPWFQLYPTRDRSITKTLLDRAAAAGAKVLVLTVDTPVVGNRERTGTKLLDLIKAGKLKMGNFEGILPPGEPFTDPSMTWDMVKWLKDNCEMKIVLKGIVRYDDANLSISNGADGIIVSNHGGRQLESNRATIDCLPEVVNAVKGRIPVLIDGGIRRGTDVFKALAMGADAICIGRPYCWGLGAMGQKGVELALDLLTAELVRDMKLAGPSSINKITPDFVTL
jgi:isopentenyl diphosphate isomerase/L-lactate dehydrogenase-like FMN-dependent dehydrogenase